MVSGVWCPPPRRARANPERLPLLLAFRTAPSLPRRKSYGYFHGGPNPYDPAGGSPDPSGKGGIPEDTPAELFAPVIAVYSRAAGAGAGTGDGTAEGRAAPRAAVPTATSLLVELDGGALNVWGGSNYSTFGKIWLNLTATDGAGTLGAAAGAGDGLFNSGSPELKFELEVTWQGKKPTRLPESVWLEMRPLLPEGAMRMEVRC